MKPGPASEAAQGDRKQRAESQSPVKSRPASGPAQGDGKQRADPQSPRKSTAAPGDRKQRAGRSPSQDKWWLEQDAPNASFEAFLDVGMKKKHARAEKSPSPVRSKQAVPGFIVNFIVSVWVLIHVCRYVLVCLYIYIYREREVFMYSL